MSAVNAVHIYGNDDAQLIITLFCVDCGPARSYGSERARHNHAWLLVQTEVGGVPATADHDVGTLGDEAGFAGLVLDSIDDHVAMLHRDVFVILGVDAEVVVFCPTEHDPDRSQPQARADELQALNSVLATELVHVVVNFTDGLEEEAVEPPGTKVESDSHG